MKLAILFLSLITFAVLLISFLGIFQKSEEFRDRSPRLVESTQELEESKEVILGARAGPLILSEKQVVLGSGQQALVRLSSFSPKIYKAASNDIYCAVPREGLTVYKGKYSLDFAGNSLDLGEKEFVSETYHDGQIRLYKLDPSSNKDFIALFQYGSCNFDYLTLYGDDVQYKFKYKNGVISEQVPVDKLPEVVTDKTLVTTWYDNSPSKGLQETYHWRFKTNENSFEEI